MIAVEQVIGLALVQDLGRPGYARLGVAPSGAFDVGAHLAANAAVGNVPGAATVELLLGPLVLRARSACVVAVVGADGDDGDVLVDDLAVAPGRPFTLLPGARLTVAPGSAGVRRYVAVRGGFGVPPVLGSRARDTLAGLGPPALAVGDELPVGSDVGTALRPPGPITRAASRARGPVRLSEPVELDVLPGPRPEYFPQGALRALAARTFVVGDRCDRVAVRLEGEPVARAEDVGESGAPPRELPSEGLVAGAVQVPPSGLPVVMGPDHPLTGGYPVIAVLTRDALDRLAQVRPGTRVVLVETGSGQRPL